MRVELHTNSAYVHTQPGWISLVGTYDTMKEAAEVAADCAFNVGEPNDQYWFTIVPF